MKILRNKLITLLLVILAIKVHGAPEPAFAEQYWQDAKHTTQAEMFKRIAAEADYAQWVKTKAPNSAKIKAGDMELAKKLIIELSKDYDLRFRPSHPTTELALSGNPAVILLLEDYLKANQEEPGKWLNAELVIGALVLYSPELTQFSQLQELYTPYALEDFMNKVMAMPRSAWIRWFDANKAKLQSQQYGEVENFSRYKPIRKKEMDWTDENSYEPNSAPIDLEKNIVATGTPSTAVVQKGETYSATHLSKEVSRISLPVILIIALGGIIVLSLLVRVMFLKK